MIIYKTINLINDKIYVGKDKNNNPKYLGSGLILKKAIKKYGRCNFKKEILDYCNSEKELNEKEIYWIKKLNSVNTGYNLLEGGQGGAVKGRKLSDKTKKKISNSLIGHLVSSETKYKMSQNGKGISRNKGKKLSKETKQKISESQKGRKLSEETKKKISINQKGIKKEKLLGRKPWNKGIAHTEETKKKISISRRGISSTKGRKLSDETKKKISQKLIGKKQSIETIEKRKKTIGDPWNKGIKMPKEIGLKISNSKKGKKLNVPYGICKHCGIEMKMGHLNRYHNDNCKKFKK